MTRGYFGIGVAGIDKAMNLGNLFRSAHAFGASFIFTVGDSARLAAAKSDTGKSAGQVPFYRFASIESTRLPHGCSLVGVELAADAIDLPSFRHPRQAAYVFGGERSGLPPDVLARCAHVVKIPTQFSINVGTAGAIVMYDRLLSMRRFGERPVLPGGPAEPLPPHVFGAPIRRRRGATPADDDGRA
jgi:tRNA G18 (ribose-2'-O)-methylase SpoU